MKPTIFEKGDALYIVAPVSPFDPNQGEVEEYAFADQLRKMAPSEHIMWLRGQYVEADSANANGQMWSSDELAIKALTPNFMPVTVMHDPRTAVGLIADTKLLLPERDSVARSRIDTSLALWKHRFPEIAEEALVNYERGDLMQSMECRSPYYECAECGKLYHRVPPFDSTGIGKERAQWCAHLNENGRRILGNVVFTGTGLIFGTRGARGANDTAHLEVFQEEVAEYHEKSHRDSTRKTPRHTRRTHKMEIEDQRHVDLLAAEEKAKKVPDLEERLQKAEDEKAAAVAASEKAEAEKVAAEKERDEAKQKNEEHEEEARKRTLASDRLGKLGKDFKGALGEKTRERVNEQAGTMTDEEWSSRLDELSELTGKKPDEGGAGEPEGEGAKGGEGNDEVSAEEIARSHATGGSGNGGGGGDAQRKEVVGGLFASTAPGGSGSKAE